MHRVPLALLCCVSIARAAAAALPDAKPLQGCPIMNAGFGLSESPGLAPVDPTDTRIEVLTGKAEVDLNSGAVFSDQIRIRRGDGVLTAPGAHYDKATGQFTLDGGLLYRDPRSAISGKGADFDSESSQIHVEDAEFQIFAVPARGSAGSITVDRLNQLSLKDVTYTTCAKGAEDWVLRAGEIDIDREKGVATAHDARLEFLGVPILYTPWLSYPVSNQRESGFLLPAIGRSDSRGAEFEIPYYFNLAPNYDATLTPRYMTKRGLEFLSEFRYLGDGRDGTLVGEYLPHDKVTSQDRWLLGWENQALLGGGWRATLNGRAVSDDNYFEDLYSSTAATSQTNLERVLDFQYFDDIWSVLARFQDYQTLDASLTDTERPYKRVPQIAANAYVPDGTLGLDWSLDSELSVFERDVGPNGARLHLQPGIAWPLRYQGFWLEPAVALDRTQYSITNPEPGQHTGPSLTAPIYTVDLGTVLERGDRGGSGWLQTLEPRVQWVYIPFRQQDDLPVYDTIEPDFNLVQLFRPNRFLGYDRLGDTDEINIGLTSRFLDANNGTQLITATIGQSRFFSSQEVTLPGGTPTDSNSSDWLANLNLNLWDHWKLDLGWQWDANAGQSQRSDVRLQYKGDSQHIANIAYRYRRDSVEEVDVSAAWPLTDRWSAVVRYDYSILDSQSLESFAGFEYQNCCWGVRLVYRRYLASRSGASDTAISLQLILKGLTNVGDPTEHMLERGILGYQSD